MISTEEMSTAIKRLTPPTFSCTAEGITINKPLLNKLTGYEAKVPDYIKEGTVLEYQGKPVTDTVNITTSGATWTYVPEVTTTNKIEISPSKLQIVGGLDAIANGDSALEREIKKIWDRLNKTVSLVHNCKNCGAKLEVDEKKPIFHCKYCGSTYIIGAIQPNSTY